MRRMSNGRWSFCRGQRFQRLASFNNYKPQTNCKFFASQLAAKMAHAFFGKKYVFVSNIRACLVQQKLSPLNKTAALTFDLSKIVTKHAGAP